MEETVENQIDWFEKLKGRKAEYIRERDEAILKLQSAGNSARRPRTASLKLSGQSRRLKKC